MMNLENQTSTTPTQNTNKRNGTSRRHSNRPQLSGLALFSHLLDRSIRESIGGLPHGHSLHERYEAIRSACRRGERKAREEFANNSTLLQKALDYVRSQSTVLDLEEVLDHLRPSLRENEQRSRCNRVLDALWREYRSEDHGGLSVEDMRTIVEAVAECMPTVEDRLLCLWEAAGSYKKRVAYRIVEIVMNDDSIGAERKGDLLTRLEKRIVGHMVEVHAFDEAEALAEAKSFLDRSTMPQRPSKESAPLAPRRNNDHRARKAPAKKRAPPASPKPVAPPKKEEEHPAAVEKPKTVVLRQPPAVSLDDVQCAFEGAEGEAVLKAAEALLAKLANDGTSETTRVLNEIRGRTQTYFTSEIAQGGGSIEEIEAAVTQAHAWIEKRLQCVDDAKEKQAA